VPFHRAHVLIDEPGVPVLGGVAHPYPDTEVGQWLAVDRWRGCDDTRDDGAQRRLKPLPFKDQQSTEAVHNRATAIWASFQDDRQRKTARAIAIVHKERLELRLSRVSWKLRWRSPA